MSKRFKRKKAENSLFHHGLIKLIIVYHLSLHGDSWRDFIARNGFEDLDPISVDKPVVIICLIISFSIENQNDFTAVGFDLL
jgi:hypothetical protein